MLVLISIVSNTELMDVVRSRLFGNFQTTVETYVQTAYSQADLSDVQVQQW